MPSLVALLIERLKILLEQVCSTPLVLNNVKDLVKDLVTADDVGVDDLQSVISWIVEALRQGANDLVAANRASCIKEITENFNELKKEDKISYTNIAAALQQQLVLIMGRIKELKTILDAVSNTGFVIPVDPNLPEK